MRYLIIILFLSSCKISTKSESGIDITVSEMWNNYIESNPEFKNQDIPESYYFHNNKEDANRLAQLTLSGKKKASSCLYLLYKHYNADLPKVGTKQILTDFDGKAKAIIETISVDTIPFNKITKDYAELDMGTNIEPLKKWKKAHWNFFKSVIEQSGQKPNVHMLIVCERFEIIWKKKH